MAQSNPTGSLLAIAAAAAAGLFLLKRKKEPRVQRTTGWAVNSLCTNADMVDPDAAVSHASSWYEASAVPPLPVSPSPAHVATLAMGIEEALAAFFASHFPGCDRAPSSLLFAETATSPSELAAGTAAMLRKMAAGEGATGNRLNHFAAALVGH